MTLVSDKWARSRNDMADRLEGSRKAYSSVGVNHTRIAHP